MTRSPVARWRARPDTDDCLACRSGHRAFAILRRGGGFGLRRPSGSPSCDGFERFTGTEVSSELSDHAMPVLRALRRPVRRYIHPVQAARRADTHSRAVPVSTISGVKGRPSETRSVEIAPICAAVFHLASRVTGKARSEEHT